MLFSLRLVALSSQSLRLLRRLAVSDSRRLRTSLTALLLLSRKVSLRMRLRTSRRQSRRLVLRLSSSNIA